MRAIPAASSSLATSDTSSGESARTRLSVLSANPRPLGELRVCWALKDLVPAGFGISAVLGPERGIDGAAEPLAGVGRDRGRDVEEPLAPDRLPQMHRLVGLQGPGDKVLAVDAMLARRVPEVDELFRGIGARRSTGGRDQLIEPVDEWVGRRGRDLPPRTLLLPRTESISR